MQKYLDLLKELIRLRPVSADTDAVNRVTGRLRSFLEDHGLHCTEEELNGRKILFASTVPEKTPDLLLCAHVDVVPAVSEKQFEPEVRDGWLFARGADDCLGNAVCIAKALCEADQNASVGAVFSADEETGGETTKYMVQLGYKAKRMICILDHWDHDTICYAQKGILAVKLTARGKGGHASAPWLADNPVDRLIDGYVKFRSEWKNPDTADSWHPTMAATVLQAGMVHNQIPDTAEMMLNIRYVLPEEKEQILNRLRATGLDAELLESCPPVAVSREATEFHTLERAMADVFGRTPEYRRMNGATDARWFAELNLPIAIIGVEGGGVHGKEEKVRIASIGDYSEVLKKLSRSL